MGCLVGPVAVLMKPVDRKAGRIQEFSIVIVVLRRGVKIVLEGLMNECCSTGRLLASASTISEDY